jgi:hypothetical protein
LPAAVAVAYTLIPLLEGRWLMPKYVIQRRFEVGADVPALGRESNVVIKEQVPEVTWIHSHVAMEDEGQHVRMFCIYEAPNEAALYRHAEALGHHVVEAIFEVAGDVTPADFPLDDPA